MQQIHESLRELIWLGLSLPSSNKEVRKRFYLIFIMSASSKSGLKDWLRQSQKW